ncbi:hypothetical protein L1987_53342 [Smallanthus sonchifolius]|uniref:Uncharacterized protein n=1 Tax=Smallanthus sonchifolius TaxID=185202 RepID=A0ACB9EVQ9_9ASTR|nr:hypothetical protein L1987_53342 [Smallanthus sonchifolius]
MARKNDTKGKGKEPESSSKRRRGEVIESSSEEEAEQMQEDASSEEETQGTEDSLAFHYAGVEEVYTEQIVQWMFTLRKIDGDNPPVNTILQSTANGKVMDLSFNVIERLANFDSGPDPVRPYEYVAERRLTYNIVDDP